MMCTGKPQLIRQFWTDKFFKRDVKYSEGYWDLAIILLSNSIIDPPQIERFVSRLALGGNYESLTKGQIEVLRSYNFFQYIKEYLFEGNLFTQPFNGYNNANTNTNTILFT